MIGVLRQAYRAGGYRALRQRLLEFQLEDRRTGSGLPSEIAESYAILGDKDQAFVWLNRAYEEHDDSLSAIKTIPDFDSLRSDPCYAELLRRMNLPQ